MARDRDAVLAQTREEVAHLAERVGVAPPPVLWSNGEIARVDPRQRIMVGDGLLNAPPDVVRGIVAHELGHVVCRHDSRRAANLLFGLAVVGGLATALVAWLLGLPDARPALLGVVGFFLSLVLGLPRFGASVRPHEFEADAKAIELLGERDSTLAALNWEHERSTRRIVRLPDFAHPPTGQRLEAARGLPERLKLGDATR